MTAVSFALALSLSAVPSSVADDVAQRLVVPQGKWVGVQTVDGQTTRVEVVFDRGRMTIGRGLQTVGYGCRFKMSRCRWAVVLCALGEATLGSGEYYGNTLELTFNPPDGPPNLRVQLQLQPAP